MMENDVLIRLKKKLKNFFCYFKSANILAVAEDKNSAPFLYLICDERYPDKLLASIAVDYPTSYNVAEIIIKARKFKIVRLTDPFYLSTLDGTSHFAEDAFHVWDGESIDLNNLIPTSKWHH